MNYVISDTHFGHKYGAEVREFDDVDHMDEYMIGMWNSIVGEDDTVYHLGDFAFDNKTRMRELVEVLNGDIILIMGNHDSWKTVKNVGFKKVHKFGIDLKHCSMCHYPMINHRRRVQLHGHVHSGEVLTYHDDYADRKFVNINMCAEHWNYEPQTIDSLVLPFLD